MTAFAFSAYSLRRSAAAVAGVQPLTSPPITFTTFDPAVLAGHSFLFFKLHGQAGDATWYGDGGIQACTADQLSLASLAGSLVFAANCWGGARSPMIEALLAAGAAAVVTGEGLNWAGTTSVDGIDVMALVWRNLLGMGLRADTALDVGKRLAQLKRPRLAADIRSFSLVGQPAARMAKG